MSVDADLFVVTPKENLVDVGNAVTKALNVYVRAKLDDYWQTHTDAKDRIQFLWCDEYKNQSEKFTNGVQIDAYDFNCMCFVFGIGDENHRMLHMITTSRDNNDITEDHKIAFSIGHWGSCDEIMGVVAEAVKPFGDVYYDRNDCDDEDYVKLFQENSDGQ